MKQVTLALIFYTISYALHAQDGASIHIDTLKFIQKSYQRAESVNGTLTGYRTFHFLEESYQPRAGYNKIIRENGKIYFEGNYKWVDTTLTQIGLFKFYDNNGTLEYTQNFDTHQRIYFYNDGTVKSRGTVDHAGKRSGVWTCYYPTAKIKSRGNVQGTLKKGLWEHFDEQGRRTKKIRYRRWTGTVHNDCCEW